MKSNLSPSAQALLTYLESDDQDPDVMLFKTYPGTKEGITQYLNDLGTIGQHIKAEYERLGHISQRYALFVAATKEGINRNS